MSSTAGRPRRERTPEKGIVIAAAPRSDAPNPDPPEHGTPQQGRAGPALSGVRPGLVRSGGGGRTAGDEGWDQEADAWLAAQAVSGSTGEVRGQAFEVLLRRHQDRIYRIALRMTGSREDAEDVAQDVAVTLWRVLASFTGSSTFSTWLYRVVVNRCRNHRRAGRVVSRDTATLPEPDQPGHPNVSSGAGPEGRVIDAAELDAATAALTALPEEQRAALVLVQIEGLSYREAAAITDISEAALRSRLERGRRALLHSMRAWT